MGPVRKRAKKLRDDLAKQKKLSMYLGQALEQAIGDNNTMTVEKEALEERIMKLTEENRKLRLALRDWEESGTAGGSR